MIWGPKVIIIILSEWSQFLEKERGCQDIELRYCCNIKKKNVEKGKQLENDLQNWEEKSNIVLT